MTPFNPPRLTREVAVLRLSARSVPLSRQDRERLADVLSAIAAEYRKGEHVDARVFRITLPPVPGAQPA